MKSNKIFSSLVSLSFSALAILASSLITNNLPVHALEEPSICEYNQGTGSVSGILGETANYRILICFDSQRRAYYVGEAKNGSGGIGPIKGNYRGGIYEFRNGKYTYVVTDKFLTVKKNGKVILKEKLLNGLYPND
ncbi:MAG TPA: hypothetical protein V6C58_05960 [Allocoleopsis sp.]